MPTYQQTVQFHRRFTIIAKDAAEATEQLEELVSSTKFFSDVECEGFSSFEDEPVECPKCKGCGFLENGEAEQECDQCKGEGIVPFSQTPNLKLKL